ncbi:MAG: methyltransferase type 11, partial [uncultured bacterium]
CKGSFAVFCCPNCRFSFVDVDFSEEETISLYTTYYPRKSFAKEIHKPFVPLPPYHAWLSGEKSNVHFFIPKQVKILDIGCGFGESLAFHKSRGCEVWGVEADKNVEFLREVYGEKIKIGEFRKENFPEAYFDFIALNQVIEHLKNPEKLLRDLKELLKPGGQLIVSTPNPLSAGRKIFGGKWLHWHVPYHVSFFSSKAMGMLCEKVGFTLARSICITSSEWFLYQLYHLASFPGHGNPSPFWGEVGKTRMQAFSFSLISWVRKFGIHHIWTRIFDVLDMGDNRIFFIDKPR